MSGSSADLPGSVHRHAFFSVSVVGLPATHDSRDRVEPVPGTALLAMVLSNSVGHKTDYEMYSMDFEEFLWACGYGEEQVAEMFQHMVDTKPFGNAVLSIYQGLFMEYCILGGMPAVVRAFVEQNNFSGTLAIQKQLLLD